MHQKREKLYLLAILASNSNNLTIKTGNKSYIIGGETARIAS